MFNKKLKERIKELESQLAIKSVLSNYNETKIQDDFLVLNQVLDLKTSHYENVVFIYNRYREEKKVNVTDEEINKATSDIIAETIKTLSTSYIEYLTTKYFDSRAALVDVYTQRVYIRLFAFANDYNVAELRKVQNRDRSATVEK